MTFETVLIETPATRATSCIVGPIDAPAFPCGCLTLLRPPSTSRWRPGCLAEQHPTNLHRCNAKFRNRLRIFRNGLDSDVRPVGRCLQMLFYNVVDRTRVSARFPSG